MISMMHQFLKHHGLGETCLFSCVQLHQAEQKQIPHVLPYVESSHCPNDYVVIQSQLTTLINTYTHFL